MSYVPSTGPIRAKFAANPEPTTIEEVCAQFEQVEKLKITFVGKLPERFNHGYPWTGRIMYRHPLASLVKRLGRYQDYIKCKIDFTLTTAQGTVFTSQQIFDLIAKKTTLQQFMEM